MTSVYFFVFLLIGTSLGAPPLNTTKAPLQPTTTKVPISPRCLYVGTCDNGLAISGDNGKTWALRNKKDGLPSDQVNVVFVLANKIYAGTTSGLAMSEDKGKTWKKVLGSLSISSIFALAPEKIYVGYSNWNILEISSDSGRSWTGITLKQGLGYGYIQSIFATSNGIIYVATIDGLSISNDHGLTWTRKTTVQGLPSNNILTVVATSGKIYAGTINGMATSTDNGRSWIKVEALGNNETRSIFIASDGKILVGTQYSGLFVSNDNGRTWTSYKTGVKSVGAADGNYIYHGTQDNDLLISEDNGRTWENHFLGSKCINSIFLGDKC